MMHLLDAEIVLALRHAQAAAGVDGLAAWATATPRSSLFVSALTLLELENAVAHAERRDKAKAAPLREWLDARVGAAFEGRILPIDAAVVRRRARIPLTDSRDALLAATALEHGLTLVTRETATFAKVARLKLFDPSSYRPETRDDDEDWGQAAKAGTQWLRNIFVRG